MNNKASKLVIFPGSYTSKNIENEIITIPAGASGSVVDFYILIKPISDANGSFIGGQGDTSLVLTSTAFTTEVQEKEDSKLLNGEYWVNYITGQCRGKKADNSVSATANYKIFN